ncbi:hypothetical protein QCA50_003382 [Cerrena zonata]|uniref:Metaxin glutathione S-transferase domain-containing protein n=1 Tax=Cerrena zonata TaxID=2478898 RepID=A0AAW0GKQ5_9APHY
MATTLPPFVHNIFTHFPLYTYPSVPSPYKARQVTSPELWIHAPRLSQVPSEHSSDLLSEDVECLKWQAYLALRGLTAIAVRWDVQPEGALEGRLPNLRVPMNEVEPKIKDDGEGDLLPAHMIKEWVDNKVGELGELEGFIDEKARDESRAWVKLLEGDIHAALEVFQPAKGASMLKLLSPYTGLHQHIQTVFTQPLQPLTGWSSFVPPYGVHIDRNAVELKYKEAISALSERLGTDKWLLGSTGPTALDALLFAYLHCLLHSTDHTLRFEITRRVNLVAWERRVNGDVRVAFQAYSKA